MYRNILHINNKQLMSQQTNCMNKSIEGATTRSGLIGISKERMRSNLNSNRYRLLHKAWIHTTNHRYVNWFTYESCSVCKKRENACYYTHISMLLSFYYKRSSRYIYIWSSFLHDPDGVLLWRLVVREYEGFPLPISTHTEHTLTRVTKETKHSHFCRRCIHVSTWREQ